MAAKRVQDKANKSVDPKAEARKEEMAALQRNRVVFALALTHGNLVERYAYMWGKETTTQTFPKVLPIYVKGGKEKYPFFTAYFFVGLYLLSPISSARSCTHASWTSRQMP